MSDKPYFHPKALVDFKGSIGNRTRVWAFAHVMKGAMVGEDCNIGDHAFIEKGSFLGNRVTVKNGVSVWEKVTLEDDVFIGPNAVFTNDLWPVSRKRDNLLPTNVRQGACIGANATILCGLEVGRYAFVGAGAVVTKNVPDHALMVGNPAQLKGYLCRCRKKLSFKKGSASCVCGSKFKMSKNKVVPAVR